MNIRTARSYDPLMVAREKPATADRAVRTVGAGATEANPDKQAKLDTYTASDSRSAATPEASPVYTRMMLSRNTQSLENKASSPDAALLASQKTRVSQDDPKALRDDVAAVKDSKALTDAEKKPKKQRKPPLQSQPKLPSPSREEEPTSVLMTSPHPQRPPRLFRI